MAQMPVACTVVVGEVSFASAASCRGKDESAGGVSVDGKRQRCEARVAQA